MVSSLRKSGCALGPGGHTASLLPGIQPLSPVGLFRPGTSATGQSHTVRRQGSRKRTNASHTPGHKAAWSQSCVKRFSMCCGRAGGDRLLCDLHRRLLPEPDQPVRGRAHERGAHPGRGRAADGRLLHQLPAPAGPHLQARALPAPPGCAPRVHPACCLPCASLARLRAPCMLALLSLACWPMLSSATPKPLLFW